MANQWSGKRPENGQESDVWAPWGVVLGKFDGAVWRDGNGEVIPHVAYWLVGGSDEEDTEKRSERIARSV